MTAFGVFKFYGNLTAIGNNDEDLLVQEGYMRLRTLHPRNKYGYNTRFMSDFDSFLDAVMNERFIEESMDYYQDENVSAEIEDMEAGLNGEFSKADIKNLLKDHSSHDHAAFKSIFHPDRVGTNYPKGDDLSCYKILPKKD